MPKTSSSLVAWDFVLRYKRFWSKLVLGTRQDNLNLSALYPKRSAVNWNNFISWDWRLGVCKFYVHKSMDTIQAGNSRVSVSSDYFLSHGKVCLQHVRSFHLYFTEAKKVNFFFQVYCICLVFLSHDKNGLKGTVPLQAWAEQSPGMQNFWHPLDWTWHAVTAFIFIISGTKM